MTSVSFKSLPLLVSHTHQEGPEGKPSTQHKCSNKNLHYDISQVFRRHITNTKKISPYESPAFSNYPGTTNLIYLPKDIYDSGKTLYTSLRDGDWEGAQDSGTRLLGAPANLASAGGALVNYAAALHLLPAGASITAFVPLSYLFGIVLCTAEGIVDSISLYRETTFRNDFDFGLIKKFEKLLCDFDPTKSPQALKELTETFSNKPEILEQMFGKKQSEQILGTLNKALREVEAKPLHYRTVLRKYSSEFNELARHMMISNFAKLQREYLELTPMEVIDICESVASEFKGKTVPMDQQLERLEEVLSDKLNLQKKQLARRLRPWMVEEASQKIAPLLKGLVENNIHAIEEGIKLAKDIDTQAIKKTLVHILGIVALVIMVASLITLIAGCPIVVPYLLMAIATTVAIARMLAYTAVLDKQGWHIDLKALIPNFLKPEEKEEEDEDKIEEFRLRHAVPLNQKYETKVHKYHFNPNGPLGFNASHPLSQRSFELL